MGDFVFGFICGCIITSIGFTNVGGVIEKQLHSIGTQAQSLIVKQNEK